MWPIGVANINARFATLVVRTKGFEAYWSQFFADFDGFVVLTSRSDAYISRSGDFCGDDDDRQTTDKTDCFTPCACARGNNNDNDDRTDYITPCACARSNYCLLLQRKLVSKIYIKIRRKKQNLASSIIEPTDNSTVDNPSPVQPLIQPTSTVLSYSTMQWS